MTSILIVDDFRILIRLIFKKLFYHSPKRSEDPSSNMLSQVANQPFYWQLQQNYQQVIAILIYQDREMYINLRNKNASLTSLNSSDALNSSAQQSRLDSSSSKRFSRKQPHHQQTNRTCKTPKMIDTALKNHVDTAKVIQRESKRMNYANSGFIKQEELYLKISSTPTKSSLYTPPISSDRATESTLHNRWLINDPKPQGRDVQTEKKKNFIDLQDQLEIKAGQIIMLQDQNMKMKGEINNLQSEHLKLRLDQQKQHKEVIKKLNDQIDTLKKEVISKNDEIKQLKKSQASLTREVKGIKYDKTMLQKQLQQIYRKKLTRDQRDIMSFREHSLTIKLQELKAVLQMQKSDKQKDMETKIGILETKHHESENKVKKFQVYASTLNKKVIDTEEQMRIRSQQFNHCFMDLKDSNESLLEQLKRTRKQNLKMKRLSIMAQQNKRITYAVSQESDALSFSLSPRNDKDL